MSPQRFLPTDRKAEANRSSLENDRTPTCTSNVTTAPAHTLSGRDSVRQPNETESSLRLTDTLGVAKTFQVATPSPNYIYYRIYAEDGAIPSKRPVSPSDPFLGRIKARSVPPPRTAKVVKRSIANVENINDREKTNLFLTPFSESPMDDAVKVTILNGTGPGSTPQEPLALVAKMSDSERTILESDGRDGLASTETTPPDIQYAYYVLYADDYEMPSKVAIDPEEPSLGRIRADSIAPPHRPASIKLCISRVERNPAIAYRHTDLFADPSCDTPLEEGHISFLRTDGPGLNPNEPMAIVLAPPIPRLPDGKYLIKNRARDLFWNAGSNPITTVYFWFCTMEFAKERTNFQWDIAHDTYGNMSMTSPFTPSSWVGANLTGSTVLFTWRLIPADGKSYYLTTDMNLDSHNPQVPTAQSKANVYGTMDTLKEGDQCQMWEFIRI